VVSAARRLAVAAALLVALGLAGCEFDEKTIGVSERQIVVHAVLDPLPATQVVLVEELLTGRVRVNERTPDSADPIVSGGGVPISGARVVVTASSGDSALSTATFRAWVPIRSPSGTRDWEFGSEKMENDPRNSKTSLITKPPVFGKPLFFPAKFQYLP
jgi:hypothetical protein